MLKSRLRHALETWKAGYDLRDWLPKSTFYRLRKELLLATGHDIAVLQPKSNVVSLQRIIYAYDAPSRPDWADALDAALKK